MKNIAVFIFLSLILTIITCSCISQKKLNYNYTYYPIDKEIYIYKDFEDWQITQIINAVNNIDCSTDHKLFNYHIHLNVQPSDIAFIDRSNSVLFLPVNGNYPDIVISDIEMKKSPKPIYTIGLYLHYSPLKTILIVNERIVGLQDYYKVALHELVHFAGLASDRHSNSHSVFAAQVEGAGNTLDQEDLDALAEIYYLNPSLFRICPGPQFN